MDEYGMDEYSKEKFTIDSDSKAEWALEKIKAATEERDRLLSLIEEKQTELELKKRDIEASCGRETDYLKYLLSEYMKTVNCKETKTQETYQLLTGKLVRKKPVVDFKVNDEQLALWLHKNGREDLIRIKATPAWAEVKKLITGNADTGCAVTETGEVVDGITVYEKPETFDIKF